MILEDLKIEVDWRIRLYCDKKLAMGSALSAVQYDRIKHVEVNRYFMKEKLNSGLICISYMLTTS